MSITLIDGIDGIIITVYQKTLSIYELSTFKMCIRLCLWRFSYHGVGIFEHTFDNMEHNKTVYN